MKYVTYNKDSDNMKWSMVYCNKNGNETPEDIVKEISSEYYIGEFHKESHTNVAGSEITNDENLFILLNFYGVNYIWQVGAKVCDMNGVIIPNLYRVRKIGYLIDQY